MIYCKIENNLVVNRLLFDAPLPEDWPEYETFVQNDEAQIGWSYVDGVFIAPPEPEPITPPPPVEAVLFLDHENRLRTLEGQPAAKMEDILARMGRG